MIVEMVLAAVLAVASLLGAGHNGVGKGHTDYQGKGVGHTDYQGKGLGHVKHGEIATCGNSDCSIPDCPCELPCVPPCDGGSGGGI